MTTQIIKSSFQHTLLGFLFLMISHFADAQMDDMAMGSTAPLRPLTAKSNEATFGQLAFARAEGDSVDKCITWLLQQPSSTSGQLKAGEYQISYMLTAPEGWYEYNNNAVTWESPQHANAHFWLFVQDGADGRIVPPLDIELTVRATDGSLISRKRLPFAWMPLVNGYGDNVYLSQNGAYTFIINIAPPAYRRHDPYNGDRFIKPVQAVVPVSFSGAPPQGVLSERMESRQDLAKKAGDAYYNTLKAMYQQANDGKDKTAGDYFIACAVEYSEGYWYEKNNKFTYENLNELTAHHNAHVEVVARDKMTGRFLHDLAVTSTLYDEQGKKIGTKGEMFMWHPWLYHYGENWRVPKAGRYRVHVHIDPPPYRRYGKNYGRQFTQPVDVDFDPIKIKTGQK